MGGFSRSLLRQIREVFPASDVSVNNPADVSDDVQFVADYLPGTLRLDRMRHETAQGAVGVVVVDLPVVPDDRYWYVEAAQAFHDDASPRLISIFIRNDNLGVVGLISASNLSADGNDIPTNVFFGSHRSFLVPAGWRVRVSTIGLAAGSQITLAATFLELPVMEKCPYL